MSSFGSCPNSIISSVSALGAISAAPAPWPARAATSKPVGQPAAQEQQAAERDDVGVEYPGQVLWAEAEVRLDLGQGHADDRRVHDDHELCERDDGKGRPAPRICGLHFGLLRVQRLT